MAMGSPQTALNYRLINEKDSKQMFKDVFSLIDAASKHTCQKLYQTLYVTASYA